MLDALSAQLADMILTLLARQLYSPSVLHAQAEVTGGGVPLSEVDCATLESRVLPSMHLCGEVLDVFGRIGGYNFYWAWVTGRLAGLQAAALLMK